MNSQTLRLCCNLLCLLPLTALADATEITRVFHQVPTPDHFEHCHGGGCASVMTVELSDDEWETVYEVFAFPAEDAAVERQNIAWAIGLMERIVGPKTGTATDRGGTFGNSNFPGQLDCNDESVNSTTYMRMLAAAGMLQYHQILDIRTRGFFLNGWPHTTAVIGEIDGGNQFAVDSWFYDNGVPPEILPFNIWLNGWKPENGPVR